MVGRSDQYRIDVGPAGDLAEVAADLTIPVAIALIDHFFGELAVVADGVAHCHDLHEGKAEKPAEISSTLPSHSDAPHHDSIAGGRAVGITANDPRGANRAGRRLSQKAPARLLSSLCHEQTSPLGW
jgi:hypothetical protein